MGAMLALGAGWLDGVLGLPAGLLRGAGLALLPFAAYLAHAARRPTLSRGAALAVIAVNIVWTLDSILLLASGWVEPTSVGTAFVLAQAAAVAGFAALEAAALRGSAAFAG
jgi:hypothetical protein